MYSQRILQSPMLNEHPDGVGQDASLLQGSTKHPFVHISEKQQSESKVACSSTQCRDPN